MIAKVKLSAVALGTILVLGSAGAVRADNWCARHVNHAQYDLDRAIAHHGYNSWQAEHARRELERVRDECRYR